MRELAPGTDRWGARRHPDGGRPLDVHGRGVGRPGHHLAPRTRRSRSRPASTPNSSWPRAPRCTSGPPPGVPKNEGRAAVLAAADALRDTGPPRRGPAGRGARPRGRRGPRPPPAARAGHRSEPLPLQVERERALFGSWYELFPRSEGAVVRRGRSRRSPAPSARPPKRLPAVAAMGFDVVYLPPIHPIGTAYRKGPNNSLSAGAARRRLALGDRLRRRAGTTRSTPTSAPSTTSTTSWRRAADLRLEIALDFALQCSPDHPWVEKHPEWFHHRPDGTIAYAENPPKKYQDIYPIAFDAGHARPGRGDAARPAVLDGPRRADLPRRQPAHQAGRLLGEGSSGRSTAPTPT